MTIYEVEDWQVFKLKTCGKTRYYVGKKSEGGYRWVTLTKEEAIDICNYAYTLDI